MSALEHMAGDHGLSTNRLAGLIVSFLIQDPSMQIMHRCYSLSMSMSAMVFE